ncbi:hypothetical protein [Caballeronia sp. LZ001]|uniref:hypothetical protein n=1 Tax=Caballeronia sp. LZ001 TaxID=3038553 RepID=UPI002858C177|nr:hypothetical protein [Caballeronia sp. LZ001]MDR5803404.1 hypothetical protein [Caballeronia sp. LZ001]
MKVIARAGLRVPHEDAPRRYITDTKRVCVPSSFYYLRRVADGDLLVVDEAADVRSDKNSTKGV